MIQGEDFEIGIRAYFLARGLHPGKEFRQTVLPSEVVAGEM